MVAAHRVPGSGGQVVVLAPLLDGELIGTVDSYGIAFWQMAYTRGESDRA